MEDQYQPISCSFYDRLEEAATLGKKVALEYFIDGKLVSDKTRVETFVIENKVEFMILASGKKIRLDRIHSLDGVLLKNHC